MYLYKKIADNSSNKSLSHLMRHKRFVYFTSLLHKLNKPIRILDIGGTQGYWVNMGLDDKDVKITLLNKFKLGHIPRKQNIEDARLIVDEIRLLTIKEMKELFPKSVIWKERFGGVIKSIVAHNLSE